MSKRQKGYTLLILLFAVSILSIGLIVAVPVWQTQIQRENEEELIFRGNQFIEAVRLYQLKKPGAFPSTLEELVEEKCLRRLYRDPMTTHGEWNIILPYQRGATTQPRQPRQPRESSDNPFERTSQRRRGRTSQEGTSRAGQAGGRSAAAIQKIYIVPLSALTSVDNPQIIGVVSSSNKSSFKIYQENESYDKWLFFHGMDPSNLPEIIYFGQEEEKD